VLRLCFVASECTPYAKTGGLADVVAGLSRYLSDLGQDVRVFMPLYDTISRKDREIRPVDFLQGMTIDMAGRRLVANVHVMRVGKSDQWIHLVDCPEMYHRGGLYRGDGDEHLRFALLSRIAIESCQRMAWAPDVFHVHDWHAAMVPLYLKTVYAWDRLFEKSRSVLTIHNLAYQGWFPDRVAQEIGFGDFRSMLHQDDLQAGALSFLKTGIIYADWLTTVSRTYAREIQGDEHGQGLQSMLRAREDHLTGIVNGVDYADWDPATDPYIAQHFSRSDLSGKAVCRRDLLSSMGLRPSDDAAVIGMVTRLTPQKGVEFMQEVLPEVLRSRNVRFVGLGSGESRYEEFFQSLQKHFPGRAAYFRGYQEKLAHMIEAGADMFLMPSRFEPCGLNQMYSLRYGTIPVVRKTGGLADTVELWDPVRDTGTGFMFDHATAQGLRWALGAALDLFERDRAAWTRLMMRGMAQDFSWERQGREYLALYARLSGK